MQRHSPLSCPAMLLGSRPRARQPSFNPYQLTILSIHISPNILLTSPTLPPINNILPNLSPSPSSPNSSSMPVDLVFSEAVRFHVQPAFACFHEILVIKISMFVSKMKMELAFKNFEVVPSPETPKIYRHEIYTPAIMTEQLQNHE